MSLSVFDPIKRGFGSFCVGVREHFTDNNRRNKAERKVISPDNGGVMRQLQGMSAQKITLMCECD